MDSTDAVRGGYDNVPQHGTQAEGLAGAASQTREEWDGESYTMKKDNMMGHLLIFNNKSFDKEHGFSVRHGTDIDAENMEKLFSTMGFNVTVVKDATKAQMLQTMDKVSKEDHSSSNCFVCIILTHAEGGRIVYGTDVQVNVDDLIVKVKGDKCPSLAGKPKLFFVQSCWSDIDPDYEYTNTDDETCPIIEEPEILPLEADFFLFQSNVSGQFAWDRGQKDKIQGSWFIQAVYDVFSSSWKKKDLNSMCTKVTAKVAELLSEKAKGEKPNPFPAPSEMPPCITSNLRKELHFFG